MKDFFAIILNKCLSLGCYILKPIFKKDGSATPGYYASKLNKYILDDLKYPKYVIGVTGSSGKGSTTSMIAHILSNSGYKVVWNKNGSNLYNAAITLILNHTNPFTKKINADVLLMELDEEGKDVYDYVRYLHRNGSVDLNEVIGMVKKLSNNKNLLMNLITLEFIEDDDNALIAKEDEEIKKYQKDYLEVDFISRKVLIDQEEIHLTPIEFNLLKLLIEHRGKVLTHNYIQKEIWGYQDHSNQNALRVFMATLRRKIEKDTNHPHFIVTEVGVGYYFKD